MLDFETLDVGECPVILSIGAVVFNEHEIVDCISEKIDQQSCLDLGCTISQDTIEWWEKQSNTAKLATFGGKTNIGYAMGMLVDLYKSHGCQEIWSAGSLADIRWSNNILEKLQMEKPWKFYQEMCFRTFRVFMPQIEFKKTGTAHNALDDAINQAKYWIEATRKLKQVLFEGVDTSCIDEADFSIAVNFDENGKMSFSPVNGTKKFHAQPEIDNDMPF